MSMCIYIYIWIYFNVYWLRLTMDVMSIAARSKPQHFSLLVDCNTSHNPYTNPWSTSQIHFSQRCLLYFVVVIIKLMYEPMLEPMLMFMIYLVARHYKSGETFSNFATRSLLHRLWLQMWEGKMMALVSLYFGFILCILGGSGDTSSILMSYM